MQMLEQKLNEYAERFDENFPIFFFRNAPEEEIIKKIDECLEADRPFETDADQDDEDI